MQRFNTMTLSYTFFSARATCGTADARERFRDRGSVVLCHVGQLVPGMWLILGKFSDCERSITSVKNWEYNCKRVAGAGVNLSLHAN
eukprot:1608246-Prymnesium_polylepis.1